jgi:proline iminopeptidase
LPELLAPPYRVVSYDQRGCGTSTCEPSFEVMQQVADLDAIRCYLGADRIHLFGHSWGGLLAQVYAQAHPAHIASMVLCCSMANTGRNAAMESRAIAERVIGRHKRASLTWMAAGILMQFPGRWGDRGYGHIMKQLLPHYVVRPDRAPRGFDVHRVSKRAWRGTTMSIRAMDENHLSNLSLDAPVLIISGEHDVIRETHAVLAERYPAATSVRIGDAAHFPWLEQPDAFAHAVLAFYRQSSIDGSG